MTDRRRRREPAENTAIADETSERMLIGYCLANPVVFWSNLDRVQPEDFYGPRYARIWQAMLKCGQKGQPPKINLVHMLIKGDKEEATALPMFLEIIKNDAVSQEKVQSIEVYIETILALSQKRALLDALDEAATKIRTAEFGTDPEALRNEAMSAITSTSTRSSSDRYMMTFEEHAERLTQEINQDLQYTGEGRARGLTPGLKAVEEVIGPLLAGNVYVLGGVSGGGKTALAASIMTAGAEDAKRKDLGWVYNASMEMQGRQHISRFWAGELGYTSFKIERSEINNSELEHLATRGIELARKLPILIDKFPRMTIENIRTRMIQEKHRRGLAMGIIDHLLLVRGGAKEGLNDRVMNLAIEIKLLADELQIPILVLSQVNEKNVMERPSLRPIAADLFGSQAIQQNADATFFVHRPEVTLRKKGPKSQSGEDKDRHIERLESLKGKAIVYSDKGRGQKGGEERELIFDGPSISFRDV